MIRKIISMIVFSGGSRKRKLSYQEKFRNMFKKGAGKESKAHQRGYGFGVRHKEKGF